MCAPLDDAVSGSCTRISIVLRKDGEISVEDNGAGWPVDATKDGRRRAEVLMTTLGVCRAFRRNAEIGAKFCGMGVAAANALSSTCRFETRRDGFLWQQQYREGEMVTSFTQGPATASSGSKISFVPDATILRARLDVAELEKRLDEMRRIATGCTIELVDDR